MKKFILFCLVAIPAFVSNAQLSSLSENFNISCASATGFPLGWISFDPTTGSYAQTPGSWSCGPTNGRDATPGMECTGDYGSSYHSDTSLLISPMLYLSGTYPDSVYLHFDTKTTFISGERLALEASLDSTFPDSTSTYLAMTPIIGPGDSTGWVTHEVNLTPFKGSYFFVAFRYTALSTYGTEWYLDNIQTSPWSLGINQVTDEKIPLTVTGIANSSEIKFTYSVPIAGTYNLVIYDMMGREIYKDILNTASGQKNYIISGLNIPPGMYCIKMGNDEAYGIAKAIVE